MKSTAAAGSVLALSLLLGACGSTDDGKSDTTTGTEDTSTEPGTVNGNDTGTDDTGTDGTGTSADGSNTDSASGAGAPSENQDDMKAKMDKLGYDEFELEVDYGKNKEYEIEIEQDNGVIESTVQDELSNKDLKGQDAFNDIYPKLQELTITETTTKEEAIQQALDAFGLKDDYVKFDMELTMPDGKKLGFEDKK